VLHPVQIVYLGVKELSLITHELPELSKKIILEDKMKPRYSVSRGEYDTENHNINVFIDCEIGSADQKDGTPLYIRVIIGVLFLIIDPVKFTSTDVINFANNYSKFMIYPFIREHVYSLSVRAGFQPIILPSIQVPIFSRTDMVEKPLE
jgi:preprotein translocase subunit SecB